MARPRRGPGIRLEVTVNHIDAVSQKLEDLCKAVVKKTLFDIEADVKNSMGEPGRGRTYVRRRGGTHTASAPGDPLASDTGQAINSIRTELDPSGMHGTVFFDAEYFVYGEFGTVNMAPRPTVTPAVERIAPQFLEAVERIGRGLV